MGTRPALFGEQSTGRPLRWMTTQASGDAGQNPAYRLTHHRTQPDPLVYVPLAMQVRDRSAESSRDDWKTSPLFRKHAATCRASSRSKASCARQPAACRRGLPRDRLSRRRRRRPTVLTTSWHANDVRATAASFADFLLPSFLCGGAIAFRLLDPAPIALGLSANVVGLDLLPQLDAQVQEEHAEGEYRRSAAEPDRNVHQAHARRIGPTRRRSILPLTTHRANDCRALPAPLPAVDRRVRHPGRDELWPSSSDARP
jgi:hypothetical protein